MFPWLWFWAPQVHFPWSGSVAQHIAPETDWFFGGIRPSAGDARIEQQAFAVASYGRQLGLITEVLLEITQASKGKLSAKAQESIARLEKIRDEIEGLKLQEYTRVAQSLAEQVHAVQQRGGAPAQALQRRLTPLLKG